MLDRDPSWIAAKNEPTDEVYERSCRIARTLGRTNTEPSSPTGSHLSGLLLPVGELLQAAVERSPPPARRCSSQRSASRPAALRGSFAADLLAPRLPHARFPRKGGLSSSRARSSARRAMQGKLIVSERRSSASSGWSARSPVKTRRACSPAWRSTSRAAPIAGPITTGCLKRRAGSLASGMSNWWRLAPMAPRRCGRMPASGKA